MGYKLEVSMGEGKPNQVFLDHLIGKGDSIRTLPDSLKDKNWHFGYYRGLKFIAETYTSLKFPEKKSVISFIKNEREKVAADVERETVKKIIRRHKGCLQCFDDVLADVDRLFSWASMITS
jgi:hypothetical protein